MLTLRTFRRAECLNDSNLDLSAEVSRKLDESEAKSSRPTYYLLEVCGI